MLGNDVKIGVRLAALEGTLSAILVALSNKGVISIDQSLEISKAVANSCQDGMLGLVAKGDLSNDGLADLSESIYGFYNQLKAISCGSINPEVESPTE